MTRPQLQLLSAIILCCVGIIIYSNTFHSSFHFDDTGFIVENVSIRYLADLKAIWNYWASRFITFLTFAVNYQINGLNVFGYHLVNLTIHIGSSIGVFWLTLLILSTPNIKDEPISKHSLPIALFTGLIFLSHPIQTESVTYIFQRASCLAGFFYILSVCLYLKSRLLQQENKPSSGWYILSLVFCLLAMLTKENTLTLPLMIFLCEFCFFKKRRYRYTIAFLILLPIVPILLVLTKSVLSRDVETLITHGTYPEFYYFLTQFRIMSTYIRLSFIPIHQNLEYDYPLIKTFFDASALTSILALAIIFISSIKLFNRYRLISFGIFWFFITILPESSLIHVKKDVIFEHWLYLPLVGYSLFLVTTAYQLLGKKGFKSMVIVLLILVACYSSLTYARNFIWKDEITLWNDTVRKSPQAPRPYIILGLAYGDKGDYDKAISNYNKAIQLIPNNAHPYNGRGLAYAAKGDYDQAISDYNKSIRLDPGYAEPYNNRGVSYAAKGDYDKAISDYDKAIQLIPTLAHAYNNRGVAHVVKGNFAQAISDYDKAIKLNPNYAETYSNRGSLYFHEGNYDQAILDFNKAIQINRNDLEAYQIRASMYTKTGKYDKAISDYDKVIQINPDSEKAYYNRGTAYGYKGIYDQAISDFTHAISIKPDYLQAYTNRAVAYYHKRQYERAWEDVRRIISQGGEVNAEFLEALKQASGRER